MLKETLDSLFKQREDINNKIQETINNAVTEQGINIGDDFKFVDGYYSDKICTRVNENGYRIKKKDGSFNDQIGYKSFCYADVVYKHVEKI